MFDTAPYEQKMKQAMDRFRDELKKIRTGRAHPGILDGIQVEAYGTNMPLNQVANVTAPEAQMLLVTPFDPSNISAIAAAIRDSQSLGLNPSDDGHVVRVPIPSLTEERRRELVKQAGEKAEEARIGLRNARQDGIKEARRQKDSKELSEDQVKSAEKELDSLIQKYQAEVEEIFQEKEKEVLTI